VRLVSGVVVLTAAGALVAGCGEGPKPETVAQRYVASNAASKCDVLATQLVEQLTGKRGEAALAACRRNVVRFPAPTDVRVRAVQAEGGDKPGESEEAREAEVRLLADGREAELKLAKQDGEWRIVQLGE
jgi:hypothetical protein